MPVLRADYGDEAASRDLCSTCEEVWEMEVMVGRTRGYSEIHPYCSWRCLLPPFCSTVCFSDGNIVIRILKHSWMSLRFTAVNAHENKVRHKRPAAQTPKSVSFQRFKFPLNGRFWWPAPRGLHKLCKWVQRVCVVQIRGNKIMRRKTGEKYCTLYGSLAPECSVNYLWKCWQKRSRFNKARFSGGQQQPTVRWGSVCLAASGF